MICISKPQAVAVLVLISGLASSPSAKGELKALTSYAAQYKTEFEELLAKVDATPGNFRVKARKYDELIDVLKNKFVDARALEYTAERTTTQTDNFEVSRDAAGIGAPRKTTHDYRDVRAPANMVFDSLDWKERSRYGDSKSESSTGDGGKLVHLHIQARAKGNGGGRSTIKTTPLVLKQA